MRIPKPFIFLLALFYTGCGNISEQQANHQKIREGLKKHEIKRVTENEILAAAFAQGDSIFEVFKVYSLGDTIIAYSPERDSTFTNYWMQGEGNSLIRAFNNENEHYQLKFLPTNSIVANSSDLEVQLLEAYRYSHELGQSLTSNVQKLDIEHLLYTAPLVFQDSLQGIWSLKQTKSAIILSF